MGCSKAVLVVGTILVVFLASISTSATQQPSSAPAQSPEVDGSGSPLAPTPASDECFNSLLNMSDCLTFVEAESNLTKPDKGCCPSLAGLIESNPICLCQLLGSNASSFGVSIDVNKALQLPKACRITTPSVSLCSAVGVPVGVQGPPSMGGLSPSGGMAPGTSMTPTGSFNGAPSSRSFTMVIFIGLSSAAVAMMLF